MARTIQETSEPQDSLLARHLLVAIVLFVAAGAPLVYAVWRFVNEALLGVVHATSVAIAVVGLAGLFLLLRLVARQIRIWEGR
jgi:hypothetical protein